MDFLKLKYFNYVYKFLFYYYAEERVLLEYLLVLEYL